MGEVVCQGVREVGSVILGPGGRREGGRAAVSLPDLPSQQRSLVQRAKKYAMEQSIKIVLMKQTLAHQQAQAKTLQRQQAIVLMCRIYVGSINFEVREEQLKTMFSPFGPLKSVSMSWDPMTQKHKGFAFIDFETPEAAQLALDQMNGNFLSGRNIKVGRPSNMPQAQAIIDDIQREALTLHNRVYIGGVHKDLTVEDIKSVFEAFGKIKSCDLAPSSVAGRHKGYGFIEYDTIQSCQDAISSMNQFDLGGQLLRVGRAITPPECRSWGTSAPAQTNIPTASAVAAAAVTARIQAMDAVANNFGVDSRDIKREQEKEERKREKERQEREKERESREVKNTQKDRERERGPSPAHKRRARETPPPPEPAPPAPTSAPPPSTALQDTQAELERKLNEAERGENENVTLSQQENIQIKGQSARKLVMQKLIGARGVRESRVLCLKNMVGTEELDDQLQEEIEEECSKYGDVENVLIYQERQSEEDDAEIVVKIFVEFGHPSHAKVVCERVFEKYQLSSLYRREERVCTGGFLAGGLWWPRSTTNFCSRSRIFLIRRISRDISHFLMINPSVFMS